MAETDARKRNIIDTIRSFLHSPDAGKTVSSSVELDRFLDDASCLILQAFSGAKTDRVFLSNSASITDKSDQQKVLLFYKTSPSVVTEENFDELVCLTSVLDSPIFSLFHTLRKVYSPALLHDDKWASKVENKLQKVLAELETGLGSALRRQQGDTDEEAQRASKKDLSAVLTVQDEYQFWCDMLFRSDLKREHLEAADLIKSALEPLKSDFAQIDSTDENDVLELLERAQDSLDDVWRQDTSKPYPQQRMTHLFSVISGELLGYIQRKCKFSVWSEQFNKVKSVLEMSIQMCEKWKEICEALTTKFWPQYDPHPWNGNPYEDEYLEKFAQRLEEVLNVRSVHAQLQRLLSHEEREQLKVDTVLGRTFAGTRPLLYNPYTESKWQSATTEYEKAMLPIEVAIAVKLGPKLAGSGTSGATPLSLLREFQRYGLLLKRPTIRNEISQDRERLLGQLLAQIQSLRDEFDNRSSNLKHGMSDSKPPSGKDLPEVVSGIVWARQMSAKVKQMQTAGPDLLSDLPRFADLIQKCDELILDLKAFESTYLEDWISEVHDGLSDSSLSLEMSGKLMDIDYERGGKLHVNFSQRLVALIREVRILSSLGFKIPKNILKATETAEKFSRHGVVLKQVANFYNTIDQQMIPSTKPVLLELAVKLENVIMNPTGADKKKGASKKQGSVTWKDPGRLEAYINTLQKSAESLTSANRKLRKFHGILTERVIQLMSIDLLRHQKRWKDVLSQTRQIFEALERQGFRNMQGWKRHWDHQLYKALEHQYQLGLESLHENLPEINVDIVYKQQKLQFRPPFEDIRTKYYRELKKFIQIPSHFPGLGESSFFKEMLDRNSDRLSVVYQKAENLFTKLQKKKDEFNSLVALGSIDLFAFVEEHMKVVADWEWNFKALKTHSRDAEKLPSDFKVDCINVSLGPLKSAVDDHMQTLADALVSSLRRATQKQIQEIDTYITTSTEKLGERPQTAIEIGAANQAAREISATKAAIFGLFGEVEAKNRLLRSIVGEGLDIASLQLRWATLDDTLLSHELLIKEQAEVLKSGVEQKVSEFLKEIQKFAARWNELKPKEIPEGASRDAALQAVQTVKDRRAEYDELEKSANDLGIECQHFDISPPDLSEIQEIGLDIEQAEIMWSLFEEYLVELAKLTEQDWISFRHRLFEFDDFRTQWQNKLRDRNTDIVGLYVARELDSYKKWAPLLKFVRGDAMRDNHWSRLYRLLGLKSNLRREDLTFGNFMNVSDMLIEKESEIKELHTRAQGEVAIREALQELELWGQDTKFVLVDRSDNEKSIKLITDWKDLITQVGDNQSLLNSLKDSPFFEPFADEAGSWEIRLAAIDSCLHLMNQIQRRWVYLEPIFGRGALPKEQGRFKRIDTDFVDIMTGVTADPRVMSLVSIPGLSDNLTTMLEQLERCQKALAAYLEEKRSKFPRFYFIGDDDLLEILGQARNPEVIQSHLKKLFQGIHSVGFSEELNKIVAIKSIEGEHIALENEVAITDEVESWLAALAEEMVNSLAVLLTKCVKKTDLDLTGFPSQILCLANEIKFTSLAEQCLGSNTVQKLVDTLKANLEQYTILDTSGDKVLSLKVKALVLDIIHQLAVAEQLLSFGDDVTTGMWLWQKQARHYFSKEKRCIIRMCDAQFSYTYEYQGNASKLVHTPLTDKCYLTLTQGMHMGYGGNPYGPAGTGKTESVKALGQVMGRQVLVFNCDEGIDFKSMGRIFTGLVKCGAWGCFDEFNRLDEEVLSAVSQQIQVIQSALKARDLTMELLGSTVEVDANAGIFVTMNPAGKGYGGRQKLPDNLKQLFRPVSMSAPDNDLIAEVILYSEGFSFAKEISHKLVSVFTLSKQMLSPQQHYDWGLRALKTVLQIGGNLVQSAKREGKTVTENTENELIVKAVRVNTLSKLTYNDAMRFNALLHDVFPGTEVGDVEYEQLEKAIKETLAEQNCEIIDAQIRKILQFYENLRQRMGVVIVGPSGSGKSTLWQTLQLSLQKIGHKVVRHTMNPKALHREKLLGHMDLDTREWSDGVLTFAARQVVKEPTEVRSWIVCDGDIDPEWVESLNSVLDDNRLLTMPSGERIKFGPNVNFVFETHSLKFASPATVSRMGMIFLSDEDMSAKKLIAAWLARQPAESQILLQDMIDNYFYRALDWIWDQDDALVVETTRLGLVQTGLSHLHNISTSSEFALALIRALGANMLITTRNSFATQLFGWVGERPPDYQKPVDCYCDARSGNLLPFSDDIGELDYDDIASRPLIMTAEVQRDMAFFKPWMDNLEPFVVVGPEGCGKRLLLEHCFADLKNTAVTTIHCSAHTTSAEVVSKLLSVCTMQSTNVGRVLRPSGADKLILFLQDINLPEPDKYDTVQVVELLRQMITYRGFFDDNLEWVGLEKVQIVGCMSPPTAVGRHPLSTRFASIIRAVSVEYPDRGKLELIYRSFLDAVLGKAYSDHHLWKYPENRRRLVGTMVTVLINSREKFPVDDHPHYQFTPRELTEWVLSMLRYDLNGEEIADVFVHSAGRLFRDKLVGSHHQKRFDTMLLSALKADWQVSGSGVGSKFYYTTWNEGQEAEERNDAIDGSKPLIRIKDKNFNEFVAGHLKDFERENRELHIQVFPEVLSHIANLENILSRPGGSVFLVGRSGVGRKTAALLVSHISRTQFFSPNMTRTYATKNFRNDLKTVLHTAGIEDEDIIMFVEDHQITDPAILEDINNLLSSGEVPGLYAKDELEAITTQLKEAAGQEDFRGTVFQYFTSRARRRLHIIISMDPTGSSFLGRCQRNPALYAHCAIQWLDTWTKDSLKHVTSIHLQGEVKNETIKEKDIPGLVSALVGIHQGMVTEGGSTPREYMAFLDTFRRILTWKNDSMMEQQSHLTAGLSKLEDAKTTVDELSRAAAGQEKLLAEKQKLADEALVKITESMSNASTQQKEMASLQTKLSEEKVKLSTRKSEIDAELAGVEPLLASAREAVGSIQSRDLNEMKSLRMPPPAVRDVLEGVLMLMGVQDTSWNSMRTFLKQTGVVDSIINYDVIKVTKDIRSRVTKLLKEKANSFEAKVISRVSLAAAPLAAWVKANTQYSAVVQNIAPLMEDQKRLNDTLVASEEKLQKLEANLKVLDEQVAKLKEEFAQRTGEAEKLKLSLEKAQQTIANSSKLLSKLDDERTRWDIQVKEMQAVIDVLPKYAILAGAFVNYLTNEPEDVRKSRLTRWKALVSTKGKADDFIFDRFMTTESEQLQWKSEGLPADDLSTENAVGILRSEKTALIIDPSMQATEWLKKHLSAKSALEITTPQDPRFQNTLELAVRFGKVLVVQEADTIEPVLFPLLRRDLMRYGIRLSIQIGDKAVEHNENFRMYLVTRNPRPDLPPDASALVSLVNFTVTRSGLEGRLLGLTIQNERPELEKKKSEMLAKEEEQKIQLAKLERELLQELATSEGNILENRSLIDALTQTKAKSLTIASALEESKKIQASLDTEREAYRPIAKHGSTIFFSIKSLQHVNHVYQFSLGLFVKIFMQSFHRAEKAKTVEDRLSSVSSTLLRDALSYVSRSLFKRDRMMLAMHLASCVRPDLVPKTEWDVFLGQAAGGSSTGGGASVPSWISEDRTPAFVILATVLPTLVRSLDLESEKWSRWAESAQPEIDWPADSVKKISTFQRVLIIQALRPDRLVSALQGFAMHALGVAQLSPPPVNFERLYKDETTCSEPILVLVTPGADPSSELQDLAERIVGKAHYYEVAMGQGQSDIAIRLVRQCAKSGEWLCLKNLHLVTSWLNTLEKELNSLNPHDNFRLCLTSEPHLKLPSILLQSALKITYEAPPGVKRNLLRTYDMWGPETIEGPKSVMHAQSAFVLAWFHAVVQERRTYMPQGWVKFYEFSEADLKSAQLIIDELLKLTLSAKSGDPQWIYLKGLMENAIYGGRVDNEYDARVLRTYLDLYFNSDTIPRPPRQSTQRLAGMLELPDEISYSAYTSIIDDMPESDSPKFFGLPANIDRTVQRANSLAVISHLKTISFGSIAGNLRFDREEWSSRLNPILGVWDRLKATHGILGGDRPKSRGLRKAMSIPSLKRSASFTNEAKQDNVQMPVNTFIELESVNAQALCVTVDDALSEISQVLTGASLLTSRAWTVATSLLGGKIPGAWQDRWEGPEDPFEWLRELALRTASAIEWSLHAESGSLFKRALNLGDLFRPATFLNAIRQQTARLSGVPMNSLKLVNTWDHGVLQDCVLSVSVTGLLLQGANFDGSRLSMCKANDPSVSSIPPCHIAYVPIDEEFAAQSSTVSIPLYETASREKFVAEFEMPIAKNDSTTWILSSTSLFLRDL